MSFLPARGELGEQPLQPVHGRDPLIRQLVAVVDKHPQRLELAVGGKDAQVLGADRGDRDRVRVVGVGLAAVAGVEEPCPGCELGGDIDDAFTGFQQALRQWAAHAEAAFDCPRPVRPLVHVLPHRREAGLVGGEPARPQEVLSLVDDLDRGRQLVGIDPDDNFFMDALALCREWMGRRGGHCYYELGSPLLSHASHGARRSANRNRATPSSRVGSRKESVPSSTWTESGLTPVLQAIL